MVYWDTNSSTSGSSGGTTAAGTWDQNTTANWTTNSGGTAATGTWQARAVGGGIATFSAGTNATGSYTVTVSGTVTNVRGLTFEEGTIALSGGTLTLGATSTVNTNANNASISSTIGGTNFGITKTGTGTLTLTGSNTYTGATTISNGVLAVSTLANGGSASGIGQSNTNAANLVLNGGTLRYTGSGNSSNRLFTLGTAGGTLDASGTGALTLSATGTMARSGSGNRTLTLTGTNTGNNTLATVISNPSGGATSVTKTGAGTWVLTGSNTYTGATTINNGILSISSFSNLGNSGNALVLDGGTLRYTGGSTTSSRLPTIGASGGTIEASGSGTVSFTSASNVLFTGSGARTFTLTGTNTGNNAYHSVIGDGTGGATTLVKSGTGTWLFDGNNANTYTGNTYVNAGTLILDKKSGRDATGTGNIYIGDGTNSATLRYLNTNNQLANSANVYLNSFGTFNLNGRTDSLGAIGDGPSVGSGFGQVQLGAGILTVGASNLSTTFSGVVSGTGSLTKTGTGTWTLAGNNTFSGGLTLSGGGINLNHAGAVGTGTFAIGTGTTIDNTSGSAVTLANNNAITLSGNITFGGSNDLNLGNNTVTLGADSTLTTNGSGILTIGGVVTDTGGAKDLNKAGSGTLVLNGANTYGGVTRIYGGVLSVSNLANGGVASGIGDAGNWSGNLVLDGGTLRYTGAVTTSNRSFSIGTSGGTIESAGTGTVTFSNTGTLGYSGTGSRTLTLSGASDGVFAPILGDSGGATALVKSGAGTWTLTGNNTYTGTTTVSGGTLQVGNGGATGTLGSGAVTNNADLVFNRTGTLTVSGGIAGTGAVTQQGSGTTVLAGAGSYTGGTTVNAGTLRLANVAGMGAAGAAVNLAGGTLALGTDTSVNAYNTTISGSATIQSDKATAASAGITHTLGTLAIGGQTLSITGGSNLATNSAFGVQFGATTLSGGATFNVANNGTGTGTLRLGAVGQSGTGSVTKTGAGTLEFSGVNTYTGGTTVSAGNLIVNSGAQLAAATGSVTMNGGTLTLNNAAQTIGTLGGTAGTIALGSGHTLSISNDGTYSGAFSGGSNTTINKNSTGTLALSGTSTAFNGTLNVNQGIVSAGSNNALGSASATASVTSGAAVAVTGNINLASNVALSGTGVSNSGALYNASGTNTVSGGITVNNHATISANTGTLTIAGAVNLAFAAPNSTLTFNASGSGAINVTGQLTDGSAINALSIAHTGTGVVTLSNGTNNYYGDTTVGTAGGSTSGTLRIGANGALPTTNNASTVRIYSGTLDLNNFNATAFGSIVLGGGASGSTAAITTGTGTLTLNQSLTFDATNNANGATISGNLALADGMHDFYINDSSAAASDLTLSGVVSAASGTAALQKWNSGTMVLSGNNTFNGRFFIQQGVVSVQHANALGASGSSANDTSVSSGATLQLNNASNLTIAETLQLSGSGVGNNGALRNVAGNNIVNGDVTITTANTRIQTDAGSSLRVNGNINSASSGSLQVGGSGNTYIAGSIGSGVTGLTKQDGSTLTLAGGNSFSGPVAVQGGTLSVQNALALGSNNTTTVSSGASVAFDSTANGNLLVANGTLNLNGDGAGSAGALRNTAGSNTFAGTVNAQTSSTITANAGTTLALGTVTGAAGSTVTFGTGGQNGSITVDGALSNANGLFNVTKSGAVSGGDGRLTIDGGGTVGTVNLAGGAITVSGPQLNTGDFTAGAGTSLLVAAGGTLNITGDALFNNGTLDNLSGGILAVTGNNTVTFVGTNTASNLTLQLGGSSAGDMSGALTVVLGNNLTVGTIEITGDTILDFGNSGSTILSSGALKLTNANAKVQVINWISTTNQATADIWFATSTVNNTTLGSQNQYPNDNSALGQITFVYPQGSEGNTTTWVADTSPGWFDHEIRPTPEPGTYGAMLMSGVLALFGWRRYRRGTKA